MKVVVFICSWIAAIIMVQTLYFKFTGSEESVYIFTTLGMEPWGRYATGIAELIAGLMLVIPRTRVFGALIGIGIMTGAILGHVAPLGGEALGIEVQGDGGQLFYYAITTMVCCQVVFFAKWKALLSLLPFFKGKRLN